MSLPNGRLTKGLTGRNKCDETLPRCQVCAFRDITCVYAGSRQSFAMTTAPTSIVQAVPEFILDGNGEVRREMHRSFRKVPDSLLWQYYLGHAGKTISAASIDSSYGDVWQSRIPAVSFSKILVAHAVLALSALCLTSHPTHMHDSFDYHSTAQSHYCAALQALRSAIASGDQTDGDAIYACSMVLIPCSLALARSCDTRDCATDWLVHLRGFRTLGQVASKSDHQQKPMVGFMPVPQVEIPMDGEQNIWPSTLNSVLGARASLLAYAMRRSRDAAMESLNDAVRMHDPGAGLLSTGTYTAAVQKLDSVMEYVLECYTANYCRAVFTWPHEVSDSFVKLLMQEDELAVAISAHWFVLLLLVDGHWYVRDFGVKHLLNVVAVLERSCSPYCLLLDWPKRMLQLWQFFAEPDFD